MTASLANQLDFILFFYGLAFLLLGMVSLTIAKGETDNARYLALGAFGILHGSSEWLDLLALIGGDSVAFASVRTAVMILSFIAFVETVRIEAARIGLPWSGRWIHALLLLPAVVVWIWAGYADANAMSRYCLCLPAGIGAAIALGKYARSQAGCIRRWAVFTMMCFALYGIAAGAVVAPATLWPASVVNQSMFFDATGIPVQLIRGLLACCIAFGVWGLWQQQVVREVSSSRYARAINRQLLLTLIAAVAILGGGWTLTQHLGVIYQQNVQNESRADFELIAGRLAAETAATESVVKVLAASPALSAMLTAGSHGDDGVNAALRLHVEAAGAEAGYVLDKSGTVMASTVPGDAGRDGAESSAFQTARLGRAGYTFNFDGNRQQVEYEAAYPVRDGKGGVLGVAALKTSIAAFQSDLSQFDRVVALVDPHGVVVLTNRPNLMLRNLWPASPGMAAAASRQIATPNAGPVLASEIANATWITVGGQRDYAQRRDIGLGDWSLIMLSTPQGITASRVLGILITLLMSALTLIFLIGRGRAIYMETQLDKRHKLEELARALDLKASTDALTGIFNRFKFNQQLAIQITRVRRYGISLSLVIYDVDHFKAINDTYGHSAGDQVLKQLTEISGRQMRSTDVHARWGGEEFVILAPDCTDMMACQMAELLRGRIERMSFDQVGTVTCSFGVAQFEFGDTPESLMARADSALYRAKQNGRNRVEIAETRQALAAAFKTAV